MIALWLQRAVVFAVLALAATYLLRRLMRRVHAALAPQACDPPCGGGCGCGR